MKDSHLSEVKQSTLHFIQAFKLSAEKRESSLQLMKSIQDLEQLGEAGGLTVRGAFRLILTSSLLEDELRPRDSSLQLVLLSS